MFRDQFQTSITVREDLTDNKKIPILEEFTQRKTSKASSKQTHDWK